MSSTRTSPQSIRAIFNGLIDPKATEYRGITMRSRLEADFAAHLDHVGVQWEYEPAIYGPKGKGYLPDFRLVGVERSTFVEVKPTFAEVAGAQRKMTVIWSYEADALLIVVCAEGSQWFAALMGEPWQTWTELWKHA